MILTRLRLRNIRSYVDQDIRFPHGSCLMSGDIGSGKSTVLLAIEFALFGIKRGSLSGNTLLRHGTNRGSVELAFEIDRSDGKDRIMICRNLRNVNGKIKQEAGHIIINGMMTEGTPIELKSKIYEILGYPMELLTKGDDLIYRYTVYTPQEQMKSILVDDPESRLDTLRRTFNIDKYKRIKTNAAAYIVKLRQKKSEYRGAIYLYPEKKESFLRHNREIEAKKEIISSMLEILEKTRKDVEQKEHGLARAQKIKDEQASIRQDIVSKNEQLVSKKSLGTKYENNWKALQGEIGNLERSIAKIPTEKIDISEKDLEKNAQELEDEIRKTDDLRLSAIKELEFLHEKLRTIENKLDGRVELITKISRNKERIIQMSSKSGARKKIKDIINTTREHIDKLNQKIARINAESERCEQDIQKMDSLSSCPTCLQPVAKDHKDKLIEKDKRIILKLESEINIHIKDLELDRKRVERYQSELETLDQKEKELALLDAETKRLEEDNSAIDEKKKEITPIKERIAKLEPLKAADTAKDKQRLAQIKSRLEGVRENNKRCDEKKRLESLRDEKQKFSDSLQKDMASLENEKIILSKEIDQLTGKIVGGFLEDFDRARDLLKEAQTKEKDAAVEHASIAKELEGLMIIAKSLGKELKAMEDIKEKMVLVSQLENWLDEFFIKAVSSMEKQVMYRIHSEFNDLFVNWFKMLIEDDTLSARLDDEFSPVIEQNGYETEVANLSGGEKTSLALAYRLALNKVINDLIQTIRTRNLIILDEPTDGFSTDQLDRIRDVLDELSSEQVIIVSHEPKMENYVDTLLKVQKSEHVSTIGF